MASVTTIVKTVTIAKITNRNQSPYTEIDAPSLTSEELPKIFKPTNLAMTTKKTTTKCSHRRNKQFPLFYPSVPPITTTLHETLLNDDNMATSLTAVASSSAVHKKQQQSLLTEPPPSEQNDVFITSLKDYETLEMEQRSHGRRSSHLTDRRYYQRTTNNNNTTTITTNNTTDINEKNCTNRAIRSSLSCAGGVPHVTLPSKSRQYSVQRKSSSIFRNSNNCRRKTIEQRTFKFLPTAFAAAALLYRIIPLTRAAFCFTAASSSLPRQTLGRMHSPSSQTANSKCSTKTAQRTKFRWLPTLGATSFVTLLTLVCLETVLLSTMSTCAKTFYMHWNTSNSIFRIDNTDHIIDVNKGNLAFEFDQVHIICPVYEPGTFENETEKYIIYNVSKVEYETCRITNADPRVIAICDKPQKLMFFTITFRPFTPQPGGLEFLPGNDYYFISTSSKDDLYRRIGGRCSTNNMKVVFKVCCAPEEKNKTSSSSTATTSVNGGSGGGSNGLINPVDNSPDVGIDLNTPPNVVNHGHGNNGHHMNNINSIGINTVNHGNGVGIGSGVQLKPINGMGTSINTNIEQLNRIPIQPNVMGGSITGVGGGILLTPGHGINILQPNRGGGVSIAQYPGHHHVQTGIRINNVPTQQYYPPHKGNSNGKGSLGNDDHDDDELHWQEDGGGRPGKTSVTPINLGGDGAGFLPPIVDTNHSNIVQSTINWPAWLTNTTTTIIKNTNNNKINTNSVSYDNSSIHTPPHRPSFGNAIHGKNDHNHHHYDKHPNEVVKNEELTYNSAATSIYSSSMGWTWPPCLLSWKWLTSVLTRMDAYTRTTTIVTLDPEAAYSSSWQFLGNKFISISLKFFILIRRCLESNVLQPLILLQFVAILLNNCIGKYTLCRGLADAASYSKNDRRTLPSPPLSRRQTLRTVSTGDLCFQGYRGRRQLQNSTRYVR